MRTMTQPATIVTQNTTVLKSVDIPVQAAPHNTDALGRDVVACAPDEDIQFYAFAKRDPVDETRKQCKWEGYTASAHSRFSLVTLVRMSGADTIEGVQIKLSKIRIHDMEFFDQDSLGLVYGTAEDSKAARSREKK